MPKNKILYIGNNTEDTDVQCRRNAKVLGVPYRGMLDSEVILEGAYHLSLADASIDKLQKIIECFDIVEFLQQEKTNDNLWVSTKILKNQTTLVDKTKKAIDNKMIFIGCSHTAGVGHSEDTVYTTVLSKMLGYEKQVFGYSGKGNYLFEEVMSEYSLKNSKIIVQFTDIYRVRFFDNDKNTVIDKQGKDYSIKDLELYTDEYLSYEFLKLVDRVVARLRDANAEFLFFMLSSDHKFYNTLNLKLSEYKEYCWTPDVFVDLAKDNLHFGIESHRMIASKLQDRWKKLYAQNQ